MKSETESQKDGTKPKIRLVTKPEMVKWVWKFFTWFHVKCYAHIKKCYPGLPYFQYSKFQLLLLLQAFPTCGLSYFELSYRHPSYLQPFLLSSPRAKSIRALTDRLDWGRLFSASAVFFFTKTAVLGCQQSW